MTRFGQALHNLDTLDEICLQDSPLHRIHPVVHVLLTFLFIGLVTSAGRYEGIRLVPFLLYPAVLMAAASVPVRPILARAALALPFVLGFGLANLLTDRQPVPFFGYVISGGWLGLAALALKTGLTVLAALLLAALTGIVKLSCALRILHVPRLFVIQVMLTYRYIAVLVEEAMWISQAYRLRAGGHGIRPKDWGSVAGSLLLGTYDRARNVYWAMTLAGFNGDVHAAGMPRPALKDYVYLASWSAFFVLCRFVDIPAWLGWIGGNL